MVDQSTRKRCTLCKAELPLAAFYKRAASADGRQPRCKSCELKRKRERRSLPPEQRDGDNLRLQRIAANRAVVIKACTGCGETKPIDAYRVSSDGSLGGRAAKCKACEKAWHAEHYRKNRERIRARNSAYMEANKEPMRARARLWAMKNREAIVAKNARRRARAEQVGEVDLDALWTGFCGLCGESIPLVALWPHPLSASVDHIVPLALGGLHAQSNLQWAHLFCNWSKGSRPS